LKCSAALARGDAETRQAQLALLRHSVRFGHGRLLLRRLEAVLACGAEMTGDDIDRCLACLLSRRDIRINQRLLELSRQLEQEPRSA
jgi:hypothetical protein